MTSPHENPTAGEMLGEIFDLLTGLGVLLLPLSILAIPCLILLLPLAILPIPFAILAAPFLLIRSLLRRRHVVSDLRGAGLNRVGASPAG